MGTLWLVGLAEVRAPLDERMNELAPLYWTLALVALMVLFLAVKAYVDYRRGK